MDRTNNWPQVSLGMQKEYRHCFGCGPDNPIGLKLVFQRDGGTARAQFTPTELHQGWSGMVHGGIILVLLDEAVSYAALFEGMYAITARFQARLSRPGRVGQELIITSSVTRKTRKLVETQAKVALTDGTVLAEATATHYVVESMEKPPNG